jgi:DNA repair protein RadC
MLQPIPDNIQAESQDKIAKVLVTLLAVEDEFDRQKEHVWIVGFNTRMVIKYVDLVSLGTLDTSLVHPREVFRNAIHHGVAAIIMGHNHPSGDLTPSHQDLLVTDRIKKAGEILGIQVHDHLIVNEAGKFYSILH